ncbi:MAG: hypothetical protein KC416_12715, partial [Myxococcales bacterium]|nr:hypothetical protein [Myxococcales bacterium]
FADAGFGVVVSGTRVANVNHETPVEQFLARHSRWLKMRAVIHVPSFVGDLFANPGALLFGAWLSSGFNPNVGLLWLSAAVLKAYGDAHLVQVLRGEPMALRWLAFAPIKDLLMALVWIHATTSRSVRWRGNTLRFGRQSRLRQDDGRLPVRVLRRLTGPPRQSP